VQKKVEEEEEVGKRSREGRCLSITCTPL